MNVHENDLRCRSLEDCYDNSVTLEIYGEKGEGLWYIDDGISYELEGSLVQFLFEDGVLWATSMIAEFKTPRNITRICMFDIPIKSAYRGNDQIALEPFLTGNCVSVDIKLNHINMPHLTSVPLLRTSIFSGQKK